MTDNLGIGNNMEVTHYTHEGYKYRQIVSKAYSPLRELRDQYKSDGHNTWINLHSTNKWQLTIQLGKEELQ